MAVQLPTRRAPDPDISELDVVRGFTTVVIQKTDEVDGHSYRRGTKASVDAATLKAMREKGMVADDAKPAA